MADRLKDQYFQPSFVNDLADKLVMNYASFDTSAFKKSIYDKSWDDKALKEMMSHISLALRQHLPSEYNEALAVLRNVAIHYQGFDGMIFPDFVGCYGVDYWNESLEALELFTQYSSGEFAIRHFILKDEKRAMKKMLEWSKHKNHHVRRLSTEGCRPRLPWAMALPSFKKNPDLILPILNNLRDDPSEYVRKSVANNLNDISKDNPSVALKIAEKWLVRSSRETQWIVKHGFRSLIKAGNPRALELLGFKSGDIKIADLQLSPGRLKLGGVLKIKFSLTNNETTKANLVVDYILHLMKSNGTTAPKVFKLSTVVLEGNETASFSKNHPIKPITTRKYYAGTSSVEILVNGQRLGHASFQLEV